MNKEKQRIAIAEALEELVPCQNCGGLGYQTGLFHHSSCDGTCSSGQCPVPTQDMCSSCGGAGTLGDSPNYPGDLNAMHQAELRLIPSAMGRYLDGLWNLPHNGVTATAAQRAEAFLWAIGKWEEDEL